MPVESAADRAMFLSDFGVTAAYAQGDVPVMMITGIFDRAHLAIEAGDGAVSGFAVTFTCRADDLAQTAAGKALTNDLLTIGCDQWRVDDAQPDGTGMVTLILRKA